MDQENREQPVVKYPCQWLYKVIGREPEKMQRAVDDLLKEEDYAMKFSKSSSKGKYSSLNLEVRVNDEETRNAIYLSLKNHPAVMMVI